MNRPDFSLAEPAPGLNRGAGPHACPRLSLPLKAPRKGIISPSLLEGVSQTGIIFPSPLEGESQGEGIIPSMAQTSGKE